MSPYPRTLLPAILLFFLSACAGLKPALPTPTPMPTFQPSRFGTAEYDLAYCTVDGQPQTMDMYFPAAGGPWPVLVYIHGGGWNEGDKAEGAGWRFLNGHGYLVVSLNYRLAAYDVKFPAMIEDVKCAVRHLRAHASEYNLDPERIGAAGASAGGHLAALLGLADESAGWDVGEYPDQSSRVQAVITMAGPSDFSLPFPGGINTAIFYAFGALAGNDSPLMTAASPVTYATPDDPPILILHGDQDGIVPLEQGPALHERLEAAGAPSTLLVVQGGDHSLRGLPGRPTVPTQEEIEAAILEFLETNLK